MSLTLATLVAGVLLLALGSILLVYSSAFRKALTAFPRSRRATFILLTSATVLVLYEVSQLGEADFGKYKNILFVFFLVLAIGSWFRVPDFLGIRALAVLGLLLSGQFLSAAYLEPPTTRLFLVVLSYLIIGTCLYLAAVPFRFRDAVTFLNRSDGSRRFIGAMLCAYGVLLFVVTLTYP